MKYQNKCVVCLKEATKKYRGRTFCDACYKKAKRARSSKSDRPEGVHVERSYKLTPCIRLVRSFFLKFKNKT
ncbi:MAG: hypothetical protein K5985_00730 [Lachnospiraceae bacterium]|nr:hypothetical protein [Lachnospiraceae bacterium]